MAKILTIYCEGKKGSHDFDILEKIVGVQNKHLSRSDSGKLTIKIWLQPTV